MSFRTALRTRAAGQDDLPDWFNRLVEAAVTRYNSEIAPVLLSRLPSEELPTSPRAASSFRARVSLLVEYSFIEIFAEFLREENLNVTFNTTNEFADFFIRDEAWNIEVRVDIKTLHDLSAEASARYNTPIGEVRALDDYLMFIAWQWQELEHHGVRVIMPRVLGALVLPALEIAEERDRRQVLAKGSFDPETGVALAASGAVDTNFGKMNRIVHNTRRAANLPPRIRKLLELMTVQEAAKAPAELEVVESLAETSAPAVTDATDDA